MVCVPPVSEASVSVAWPDEDNGTEGCATPSTVNVTDPVGVGPPLPFGPAVAVNVTGCLYCEVGSEDDRVTVGSVGIPMLAVPPLVSTVADPCRAPLVAVRCAAGEGYRHTVACPLESVVWGAAVWVPGPAVAPAVSVNGA